MARLADTTTVLVSVAALFMVGTTLWDRYKGPAVGSRYIDDWEELARDSHWRGPPDAEVVIIEFGDYECPFCRRLEPTLKSLRAQFPAEVAIAYRHYPLPQHANAYKAARLAECGARQGRFHEVHDLLYNMSDLRALHVDEVARSAGIPEPPEFIECAQRGDEHPRIERDLALARSLEVRSTPTIILNGTLLSPATPDSLQAMVRRMID